MARPRDLTEGTTPPWVKGAAVAVVVVILGLLGWVTFTKKPDSTASDPQTRPAVTSAPADIQQNRGQTPR